MVNERMLTKVFVLSTITRKTERAKSIIVGQRLSSVSTRDASTASAWVAPHNNFIEAS